MKNAQDTQVSLLGLAVMAGMIGLAFVLAQSGKPQFGKPQSISVELSALPPTLMQVPWEGSQSGKPDSIGSAIDALPATAAGQPSAMVPAPAEALRPEVYLGGTVATGRVAEVFIKAAENVFLNVNQAPEHLKKNAERWVDVQFPELLANDTASARAFVNRSDANVSVGDVVEIKFAQKDNPNFFPVKELTRVTELVASKDQMLARDYERRIIARTSRGGQGPQWLSQTPASQTEGLPAQTTTADARR